ncbi:MAG TPA: hypothetical protein VFQ42_19135 [Mycobacterium sp.]|nr:hypothetical protein [Mycobacterium sp.]
MTAAAGVVVTGPQARFRWERAVRKAGIPMHVKGFALLIATYMNADGSNARPSSKRLIEDTGYSRQRVFELLAEAESAGWLVTVKVAGKPSERRPSMPSTAPGEDGTLSLFSDLDESDDDGVTGDTPDVTRQTQTDGYPSDASDYLGVGLSHNPSDTPDDTRQTRLTQQEQDRNNQGHAAPGPLRHDPPQAPGRTDQPVPDQRTGEPPNLSPELDPPPVRAGTRASRVHRVVLTVDVPRGRPP